MHDEHLVRKPLGKIVEIGQIDVREPHSRTTVVAGAPKRQRHADT
jgi:hypothetical protein